MMSCPDCPSMAREVADLADQVAYWKYAATWLQTRLVLGRDPTAEDEDGKTWKTMAARLEAQRLAERKERQL